MGPWSHLKILGSHVPGLTERVLGPRSHLIILGSQVLGPTFPAFHYVLLTDQISLSGILYFRRYWAICLLQLLVNQVLTSQILKLIFLIEPFYYMTKKSIQKLLISWEQNELLSWNKKHFSLFLKGFQWPKIVSNLRVRL